MANGLLLLTAMIWGLAFVAVKNALDVFPPALLVGIRYLFATGLSAFLFRDHLKELSRRDILAGAVTGAFLGMAYIVQTIGLKYTTGGKNAFLTATYVVLVPFGCHFLFGERLNARHYLAAVLLFIGLGFLSLGGERSGFNRGDLLSLLCGVFFAAHMIVIPRYQKNTDVYALIVLQFLFCALIAFVWHLFFEKHEALSFSFAAFWQLFYLVVFSTTLGMSLQNIGESMTKASYAALILSLESVFGVLFSSLLLGEKLTVQMGIGFAVIFLGIILSVTAREG